MDPWVTWDSFHVIFGKKLKSQNSFKKKYPISYMSWCPTINAF